MIEVLVGFAATLRHAGVAATRDRVPALLAAAAELGAGDPAGVYWAGRLTLCSEPDDLPIYDAAFAAYVVYLTVRTLPASLRGLLARTRRA